jgi:hypothetical protein
MTDKEAIELFEFCYQCVIAVKIDDERIRLEQIKLLPTKIK